MLLYFQIQQLIETFLEALNSEIERFDSAISEQRRHTVSRFAETRICDSDLNNNCSNLPLQRSQASTEFSLSGVSTFTESLSAEEAYQQSYAKPPSHTADNWRTSPLEHYLRSKKTHSPSSHEIFQQNGIAATRRENVQPG